MRGCKAVILLATLTVSLGASLNGPNSPNSEGDFELLILHSNDIHARYDENGIDGSYCTPALKEANECYGGIARIAYLVNEARVKADNGGTPVLHLNAGDTFTGTPWHTLFRGEAASDFVNALNFDAMSLGNHEMDEGTGKLLQFINNVTKSTPVLCANIDLSKEPKLAREANLIKSTVLNVTGHEIGIIGYLTPTTKKSSNTNVEYIDEIRALKEETRKLQDKGVKIIIALGHSGYLKDIEIAKEVEGLSLVVGGHSHTLLCNDKCPYPNHYVKNNERYPTNVTAYGRVVPVVQAYCNSIYLGELHVTFNSNGEVIKAFGQPVLLNSTVPQNETVQLLIEEYKRRPIFEEVLTAVGKTSVALYRDTCSTSECNLGNLITDAIIYYYANNYVGDYWTDASIAIIQHGAIRMNIKPAVLPANVTTYDLMTVMAFNNKLTVVTMNGTVLLKMLEHSVAKFEDTNRSFLQVSGIKVVYDLSKPVGSRVVKAEARCSACHVPEYRKVKGNEEYKVIAQGFIAHGGDGFEMLKPAGKYVLDYNELVCTKYYMRNISLVYPEIEGRITVLR